MRMGRFWDGGVGQGPSYSGNPEHCGATFWAVRGPDPEDQMGWDLSPRLTSRMVSNRLNTSLEARIWPMVLCKKVRA